MCAPSSRRPETRAAFREGTGGDEPPDPGALISLGWSRALVLLGAFAAWSLAASHLLAGYAQLVVPSAEAVFHLVRPHGLELTFTTAFPNVTWALEGAPRSLMRVPFRLVAYNAVLFLTLIAAWPRLALRRRALVAGVGLPVLFLFHVADLCLAVESRLLTHLRPESYHLSQGLDLWFLAVKYYHSFSVLALKQVLPFFLMWGLVVATRRLRPEVRHEEGAPPAMGETPG